MKIKVLGLPPPGHICNRKSCFFVPTIKLWWCIIEIATKIFTKILTIYPFRHLHYKIYIFDGFHTQSPPYERTIFRVDCNFLNFFLLQNILLEVRIYFGVIFIHEKCFWKNFVFKRLQFAKIFNFERKIKRFW